MDDEGNKESKNGGRETIKGNEEKGSRDRQMIKKKKKAEEKEGTEGRKKHKNVRKEESRDSTKGML